MTPSMLSIAVATLLLVSVHGARVAHQHRVRKSNDTKWPWSWGTASPKKTGRGLLIIDVQDCFLEAMTTSGNPGSLAVKASHIIPVINKIREKDCLFDVVVKSQDFHPKGHISFGASNEVPNMPIGSPIPMRCTKPSSGKISEAACCPDPEAAPADIRSNLTKAVERMRTQEPINPACSSCFPDASQCFPMNQAMWPVHCLQNGDSTFPPTITKKDEEVIVQKGTNMWVDAYSAFMDNTKQLKTALDKVFKSAGVTELYVVGIATDFCVAWSSTDAVNLGYASVNLVQDASAGIGIPIKENWNTIDQAVADMKGIGVNVVNTADVLALECPS